jgi:8-oxo-dGTP pyrophosphatase MutT (NUDIX family)
LKTAPFSFRALAGGECEIERRKRNRRALFKRCARLWRLLTCKSGSEVLIVHRSAEQGGYWHVVAGRVEPGETATEAAERELREETGLVAKALAGVE